METSVRGDQFVFKRPIVKIDEEFWETFEYKGAVGKEFIKRPALEITPVSFGSIHTYSASDKTLKAIKEFDVEKSNKLRELMGRVHDTNPTYRDQEVCTITCPYTGFVLKTITLKELFQEGYTTLDYIDESTGKSIDRQENVLSFNPTRPKIGNRLEDWYHESVLRVFRDEWSFEKTFHRYMDFEDKEVIADNISWGKVLYINPNVNFVGKEFYISTKGRFFKKGKSFYIDSPHIEKFEDKLREEVEKYGFD